MAQDNHIQELGVACTREQLRQAVGKLAELQKSLFDSGASMNDIAAIMDLQSTNGTYLNGAKIEPARHYELLEQDNLKFGNSTREYVVMCAKGKVTD